MSRRARARETEYENRRTTPIVKDLVKGGPARAALNGVTDPEVAKIVRALDEEAAQAFFDFAGWRRNGWEDPEIISFLQSHTG